MYDVNQWPGNQTSALSTAWYLAAVHSLSSTVLTDLQKHNLG